ncbi:MAG: hypothetical protein ABJ311_14995 [Erythrobacter sp.]
MKLSRFFLATLALLTLSACVTYPNIQQSRSSCEAELGGWCSFISAAAKEAYPYAVAATNAYTGDDDVYVLPPNSEDWLKPLERLDIAPEDAGKGFDYQIFEQTKVASGPEGTITRKLMVIAFRGTDPAFNDIWHGTVKNTQINLAVDYFAREKARFPSNLPWVATGHSLGGALATEVSVANPDVTAWSFNLSPFYRGTAEANSSKRNVINERGEILEGFRKNKPASGSNIFQVNCRPQKKRFKKHSIRTVGDCLIWIAAYRDKAAFALIEANKHTKYPVNKPEVECGPLDAEHPGPNAIFITPCRHVAKRPKEELRAAKRD